MKLKVVVDTNILFSAILTPGGRIGRIILTSKKHFEFYSCDFLKTELLKHRAKLLKLSKRTPVELDELEFLLTRNITFINENLLPEEILIETEKILIDIDINDTPFVALTKHLSANLWTGDKVLASGLETSKFIKTLYTKELSDILDEMERN